MRLHLPLARARRLLKQWRRRWHRIGRTQIATTFQELGAIHSDTLFVHSSLSACGLIDGGPRTVIDALREWKGPGNLVLPTHSYCYPNEKGEREVFDPHATPSVVGAITDYFWRQPGVARSLHPTHSLAALGPAQDELCACHELCDTPCGRGTPYVRLLERDAAVLMFGATMNAYTLFHTAEDAAAVPYLYEPGPYELFARGPDGVTIIVRMRRQDMHVARRFAAMGSWLAERQALVRRSLGLGELLFVPSSARVHDLITGEMRRDPYFLVAVDARLPGKSVPVAIANETTR